MIRAIVRSAPHVKARVKCPKISTSIRDVIVKLQGDLYPGPYEVTPSDSEQQLSTSGKTMSQNVRVHPVPFALATRPEIDNLF